MAPGLDDGAHKRGSVYVKNERRLLNCLRLVALRFMGFDRLTGLVMFASPAIES